MLVRALPVTTKLSQAGLGVALGAVMIFTVWPDSRGVESAASLPSMRAATHLLPTLVCTA